MDSKVNPRGQNGLPCARKRHPSYDSNERIHQRTKQLLKRKHLLLIMLHNQPLPIQMKRHFRIHRLLRPLRLERDRRLEDILLRQVDLDPTRRRRSEHVARLGDGFGEEFGHAVELGFDAVEAPGDGDGVVEDCVLAVVRVGLFGGLELVELEDVVDEGLFAGGGSARRVGTLGGGGGHFDGGC